MKTINKGDTFYGKNADLLNQLGLKTKNGLAFQNWYKGTYVIDENTFIWMISIDGKERMGWVNQYQGEETIIESNAQNNVLTIGLTHEYRIVFDKTVGKRQNSSFVFKGVYQLQSESNNKYRVLKRVSDKIEF